MYLTLAQIWEVPTDLIISGVCVLKYIYRVNSFPGVSSPPELASLRCIYIQSFQCILRAFQCDRSQRRLDTNWRTPTNGRDLVLPPCDVITVRSSWEGMQARAICFGDHNTMNINEYMLILVSMDSGYFQQSISVGVICKQIDLTTESSIKELPDPDHQTLYQFCYGTVKTYAVG